MIIHPTQRVRADSVTAKRAALMLALLAISIVTLGLILRPADGPISTPRPAATPIQPSVAPPEPTERRTTGPIPTAPTPGDLYELRRDYELIRENQARHLAEEIRSQRAHPGSDNSPLAPAADAVEKQQEERYMIQ